MLDAVGGLGPVRDEVDCDIGFDRVTADRLANVAANREEVTRV